MNHLNVRNGILSFNNALDAAIDGKGAATESVETSYPVSKALADELVAVGTGSEPNTYTILGNRLVHTIVNLEPVVRFYVNCGGSVRAHVPEEQVVDVVKVGRCGSNDLFEITVSYF